MVSALIKRLLVAEDHRGKGADGIAPLLAAIEGRDTLLRRVKQYSGRLATEAVHAMSDQLPYFAELDAAQRASVQLVVQTAVVNFVEWIQDPEGNVKFTVEAFQVVPQDLAPVSYTHLTLPTKRIV